MHFQTKIWYYNFTKNINCDIHYLVTKKKQEQQSYLTEVESAIHQSKYYNNTLPLCLKKNISVTDMLQNNLNKMQIVQ